MTDYNFRNAREADLQDIVSMLADDSLGSRREAVGGESQEKYVRAFQAIEHDANNTLLVADVGDQAIAVLQLTLIPGLTYQGGWRAQIEGVRVSANWRGKGIGSALIQHAIGEARAYGCRMIQLTTDKKRPEAVRFYESLGFRATHEGMKLHLSEIQNRGNTNA